MAEKKWGTRVINPTSAVVRELSPLQKFKGDVSLVAWYQYIFRVVSSGIFDSGLGTCRCQDLGIKDQLCSLNLRE